MENDREYIGYYNRIEQYFRKLTGSDDYIPFLTMISNLQNNYLVRQYSQELRDHAKLRNHIQHSSGTDIYAIPSDLALNSIKKICDQFLSPKKLIDVVKNVPILLEEDAGFLHVLEQMKEYEISQFPVYQNQEYVGLISSNSISRWLANHISEDGEIIEDLTKVSVGDILKHNEKLDEAMFLPKSITVNDFLDNLFSNKNISVWLITETGKKTQRPLGIITPYDYDMILESITK